MRKSAEAHDHRDVAVEDLVKGVQRIVGRKILHRPAPLLHAQMLVLQRLRMGQRQAEEDPLDRPQARADADPQPALHQRQAARVAGVHLRRLAVHVAAELVEHDHQRHQEARVLDVQRPMVVVPARRQGHVGAEAVPDLLVGLLELAEPEVQAVLDARAEHEAEHLLGLVDLRRRDLEALDLQQHPQLALQALHLRARQRVLLVEPGQDDMQPLLDAVAGPRVDPGDPLVGLPQPANQRLHQLHRPLRLGLGGGDEVVVAGHEALDVGQGLDGGRARPRLDQAHLAEHVAGAKVPRLLALAPSPMLTSTDRPDDQEAAVSPASPSERIVLPRPEPDQSALRITLPLTRNISSHHLTTFRPRGLIRHPDRLVLTS